MLPHWIPGNAGKFNVGVLCFILKIRARCCLQIVGFLCVRKKSMNAFSTFPRLLYPLPPLLACHNLSPCLSCGWFSTWGDFPSRRHLSMFGILDCHNWRGCNCRLMGRCLGECKIFYVHRRPPNKKKIIRP